MAIDIQQEATINPQHLVPRLLYAGHFRTGPAYVTTRARGTQDWLLFYTVGGCGRIVHLDGPMVSRPGDCVILPPGLPHDYRTAPGCTEWEFYWAHFAPWPHWLGLLSWPQALRGIKYLHVSDSAADRSIRDALGRMVQRLTGPHHQAELFAMNALEEALLWLNSVNPGLAGEKFDSRIRAAMDFICRNIHQSLSLALVGKSCGLSQSRLSHVFKEQLGLTPLQYIEQQRMARARELLEMSSLRISEIAAMTGYESPFYFSRRFTAYTGKSPRVYRRG